MNSGRRIVTKIGSLPFLRGATHLWKFRQISVSPKRHWISVTSSFSFAAFDPKTKTNFQGETLYRAPIYVTPSDFRMRKISDFRIFLWVSSEHIKWPSHDFSLTWAECDSSRDLWQTPPVRELFKPAEFGSRFSSGSRTQSSSEGRTKLNIPFFVSCWISALEEFVGCWFSSGLAPTKLSSFVAALLLAASSGEESSFNWRFGLNVVGSFLYHLISLLQFQRRFSVPWFLKIELFCRVICYWAQQLWEINL